MGVLLVLTALVASIVGDSFDFADVGSPRDCRDCAKKDCRDRALLDSAPPLLYYIT